METKLKISKRRLDNSNTAPQKSQFTPCHYPLLGKISLFPPQIFLILISLFSSLPTPPPLPHLFSILYQNQTKMAPSLSSLILVWLKLTENRDGQGKQEESGLHTMHALPGVDLACPHRNGAHPQKGVMRPWYSPHAPLGSERRGVPVIVLKLNFQ